jgi:hypothetical protein
MQPRHVAVIGGKRIVTASWDATARLWDAATGKPISEPLTGHAGEVMSAVFSPDGKRIVTASEHGFGTPRPASRSASRSGQGGGRLGSGAIGGDCEQEEGGA